MKKIVITSVLILTLVGGLAALKSIKKRAPQAHYTIGIIQTASHPALDAAREGFIEELTSKLGKDVAFVVHNAQGSVPQAVALAQQCAADKSCDAFFAIATPAAQALHATEKIRPIIIAAVTDPESLGLLDAQNICGTKDMIDVKGQINLIQQLIPDAKTVGLLYTAGEANSIALVNTMKQELKLRGLSAVDFAVSNEIELPGMVELACRKVDVILAPTDNTVACTISLIAKLCNERKKPLFASDNMLVAFGALAARGVDYHESGKLAAHHAEQVLVNAKKPHELPITQAESKKIFINKNTMQRLNVQVPESMRDIAILAGES
jgi:putative ABC transport system substrate-binding protein